MPGKYRRCPKCDHVAPDQDMRCYRRVGRARKVVWLGYQCPQCGYHGSGEDFRFAAVPGTTPKPRKPRKTKAPPSPTPPELVPKRKLTLQELLSLAAGHARLVPGEDGAEVEWIKGPTEGIDRSDVKPDADPEV